MTWSKQKVTKLIESDYVEYSQINSSVSCFVILVDGNVELFVELEEHQEIQVSWWRHVSYVTSQNESQSGRGPQQ